MGVGIVVVVVFTVIVTACIYIVSGKKKPQYSRITLTSLDTTSSFLASTS